MPDLPTIATLDDYYACIKNTPLWTGCARVICERHGLDAGGLQRATDGSNIVFRAGDVWIKLFVPLWPEDAVTERTFASAVTGLPTPQIVAEGALEGWPYLILTHVTGERIGDAWPTLDDANRLRVTVQIGELMAHIHATPVAGLEVLAVDWPAFLDERKAKCIAHHGVEGAWRTDLEALLADLPPLYEPGFQPVLLSSDITDDHVLLTESGGRWDISGFVDFGDAMLGHPLYEFAAPCVFLTQGRPDLQRRLFTAYGFDAGELTPELARRVVAYVFLHKYGKMRAYRRYAPAGTGNLAGLCGSLCGF